MCRAGRLFEVQEWVAEGKPITLAEGVKSHSKLHIPLHVAMLNGFHSLVQVLVAAGAPTCDRSYVALRHALELRRPDLARLLLEHGADPSQVSLCEVIENGCDPQVIGLLLDVGKNLVDEQPIAWGLIQRIWPTLKLVKQHLAACPDLLLQVNTALRHHAHEGNAKWVALTLWAGGDPLARGPYDIDQDWYSESDPGSNAIELAASRGHVDVLQDRKLLRAIKSAGAEGTGLLAAACRSSDRRVLELVLRNGHSPQRLPNQGTEAVERVVGDMAFDLVMAQMRTRSYGGLTHFSSTARARMGVIHALLAHGARWLPENKDAIARVRKPLLKLEPAFSMEFAWLMKQHGSARRADVRDLLTTPTMRRHLSGERVSLERLLSGIPEEPSPSPGPLVDRVAVSQPAAEGTTGATARQSEGP